LLQNSWPFERLSKDLPAYMSQDLERCRCGGKVAEVSFQNLVDLDHQDLYESHKTQAPGLGPSALEIATFLMKRSHN
jgi:hypothetical protein